MKHVAVTTQISKVRMHASKTFFV